MSISSDFLYGHGACVREAKCAVADATKFTRVAAPLPCPSSDPRALLYTAVVVFDARIRLIVASLSGFNCGLASQISMLTGKTFGHTTARAHYEIY